MKYIYRIAIPALIVYFYIQPGFIRWILDYSHGYLFGIGRNLIAYCIDAGLFALLLFICITNISNGGRREQLQPFVFAVLLLTYIVRMTLVSPSGMDGNICGLIRAFQNRGNLDDLRMWSQQIAKHNTIDFDHIEPSQFHCPIRPSVLINHEQVPAALKKGLYRKQDHWPQYAIANTASGEQILVISWYSYGIICAESDVMSSIDMSYTEVSAGIYIYRDGRK